jgi:hypothetical protein
MALEITRSIPIFLAMEIPLLLRETSRSRNPEKENNLCNTRVLFFEYAVLQCIE